MRMNISSLLERSAMREPARPALFRGERQLLDYGSLRDKVARLAGWFRAQGLREGDRVALCMPNSVEYFLIVHAAFWAGLAVVPLNFKLHEREVDYIVGHSGARMLFIDGPSPAVQGAAECVQASRAWSLAEGGDAAPRAQTSADDLAWLFYTSGTTGRPKGAVLTHRNLMAMTLCYLADVARVEAEDAIVYAAPMSHGAGLYTFAYLSAGARHVVPGSGGFDGVELLELAARMKRVSLFAAPTMVNRLVEAAAQRGASGDGFANIVYGGGPMYVADLQRAREVMGARFVQIYGQGESPMTITVLPREVIEEEWHPEWLPRLASVGFRQSAVEVRVVDAQGEPVPAGTVGEVIVSGPTVMKGYWNDPAATARAIRDGWLYTGDLGSLDAAGFLTLKDRSKDLIISGGSNIYPREVEEVLLQHPRVVEAAVIGVPDPDWGEAVLAFVVLRAGEGEIEGELDRLCLANIARFKRPKRYVQVRSLAKNNYGKVLKTELRKLAAAQREPRGALPGPGT